MKLSYVLIPIGLFLLQFSSSAQTTATGKNKHLFIDVHILPSGKVNFQDVANAHIKDLAVQKKYDVEFFKFWVDESKGRVYCLSSASDSSMITATHREAHGLLPQEILEVTDGMEADAKMAGNYYLDFHELGTGNVKALEVAKAHEKDLAAQGKYGVSFLNYWVDEKKGVVMCLSQAPNPESVIETHKKAHGLLPVRVELVKQGQ